VAHVHGQRFQDILIGVQPRVSRDIDHAAVDTSRRESGPDT